MMDGGNTGAREARETRGAPSGVRSTDEQDQGAPYKGGGRGRGIRVPPCKQ